MTDDPDRREDETTDPVLDDPWTPEDPAEPDPDATVEMDVDPEPLADVPSERAEEVPEVEEAGTAAEEPAPAPRAAIEEIKAALEDAARPMDAEPGTDEDAADETSTEPDAGVRSPIPPADGDHPVETGDTGETRGIEEIRAVSGEPAEAAQVAVAEEEIEETPTATAEEPPLKTQNASDLWRRTTKWFRNLAGALTDPSWRHGSKESFRFSLVVLAALGLAYWLTNWPINNWLSDHPDINLYLIRPPIWLCVAALALHGWYRLEDRPKVSKILIGIAFLVGLFHVAVFVIAGVIWGFTDSGVSGRAINYPKNFWYITTLLAGVEMSRAFLYQVWQKYGEKLAFVLTSAIFFVVVVSRDQWNLGDGFDRVSDVVAGEWAPALALSVLATFLVQYGGIGPSFAYRFALLGFFWFSPILPDLTWPVLLIIGVLVPLASASIIRSIYEDTSEGAARLEGDPEQWDRWSRRPPAPRRTWWGWGITIAIVVVIAMFFTGTFGFRMVVIDGISMEPAYGRGDLAIVRENVDLELLEVDDVILFDRDGRPVVHRIVSIEEAGAQRVFTTQGDNVVTPDPPVLEHQVLGKVVFLIPELGHVNLWLRGG